jgi:hypothetical protein
MRSVVRNLAFTASLLTALVVAALPGTTIAASAPAHLVAGPVGDQTTPANPIVVPVSLQSLVSAVMELGVAPSADVVAHRGQGDDVSQVAPQTAADAEGALPPSILADALVISVYGHPGFCVMGELGCHDDPRGAVAAARALAERYDALNGDQPTIPALHLIVDVAQANPGADGEYLEQMPLDAIAEWVEVAREEGALLFLDIQIGWGDVFEHVQRLEPFLEEPSVHLAIDPEFVTQSRGARPGLVIGTLTADEVNRVQHYLREIVVRTGGPSKVLVVHQFRADMLTNPEQFEVMDGVEISIDMDGWGPPHPKVAGYEAYALASYSARPAFKLFEQWDEPMMTPAEVMAMSTPPAYVIYQ